MPKGTIVLALSAIFLMLKVKVMVFRAPLTFVLEIKVTVSNLALSARGCKREIGMRPVLCDRCMGIE